MQELPVEARTKTAYWEAALDQIEPGMTVREATDLLQPKGVCLSMAAAGEPVQLRLDA